MEEFGGYLLGAEIGRGGMGTVRRAVDADGHHVAVKILHPAIAADPVARARLAREVATLRRVRGNGVARVVDAEVDDAEAFIVTELIDGPTLQDDVTDFGCYTISELAELATGLFAALHQIHRAGVVHRDLKPSNVMMGESGPVLIDFGIAQVADDARLTHTGLVAGTAGYLDPQALQGEAPATSGDWWSWAAVLTFAATGRPPFGRGPLQGIVARVHAGDVDTAGLDPALARVLRDALAPNPAERPDPSWVLRQLQHFATEGFPVLDRPGVAEASEATRVVEVPAEGETRVLDQPAPAPHVNPAAATEDSDPTRMLPAADAASGDLLHSGEVDPTQQFDTGQPPTRILPTTPPGGYPPPVPYDDPFAAYPAAPPEPAPPLPRHEPAPTPWVMLCTWAALSAAALRQPVLTVGAVIIWVALSSVIGNGMGDYRETSARFGRRMGDPLRIIVRSVRHLLKHAAAALWYALLAAIVLSIAMMLSTADMSAVVVTQNMLYAAAAAALAMLIVWWHPPARWARYANRALVHTIFPSGTARTALCLALLALAIVLALTMFATAQPVQWWPLDTIKTWIVNLNAHYN